MMNVHQLVVEIELGTFAEVASVGLSQNYLHISNIDRGGYFIHTQLLPEAVIEGLFGDPPPDLSVQVIPGVTLRRVSKIEIIDQGDPPSWDFHRRVLRVHSELGVIFNFMLYCVGLRETQVA